MPKPDLDARPLLFCPFCRECYEGLSECPEHELALVPFDALPWEDEPEAVPPDDQPVVPFDLRFGRGLVMGGIVLCLVGFAMPLLDVATATQARTFTGIEAAASRAPNLWTVPFVAAMFAWILARRRTPIAMRGARLAGIVFAIAPLVSLAYTVLKVQRGAAQHAERTGQAMEITLGYGAVVIAIGAVLLLAGSIRLGVLPAPRSAPFRESGPRSPIEAGRQR